MFLKGTIYVTDDEDIVYKAPANNTRIVSLDEDGVLLKDDSILVGTCLLPPIEAKIAEADGNEQLYDMAYSNHLLEPYQREFISALFLVFKSLGVSSLSTKTNSISFTLGFGLSKIDK